MIIYKGKFLCTYKYFDFLGNMWAQQWNNIYDLVIPYKNKAKIDITPVLKEKVGFLVTKHQSVFNTNNMKILNPFTKLRKTK